MLLNIWVSLIKYGFNLGIWKISICLEPILLVSLIHFSIMLMSWEKVV